MSKKQGFKLVIKTGANTEEEREKEKEMEGLGQRKKWRRHHKEKVCIYAEEQSGKNKTNFNKSEVE